jgi:hypothetical protein
MASDGESVERLRDYLRTLQPEACAMLVAELERDLLRGEGAGNELILQELRGIIRAAGQNAPGVGEVARLFFAPLEPFVVDDAADHKRPARIARMSLEPIWIWLGRDLIPAEVNALGAGIERALRADDKAKAEQLSRALQERAVQRIRDAVAAAHHDEKARRHLAVQVGTLHALDDLDTLARVLAIREMLDELMRRLPSHFRALEAEQIDTIRSTLESAAALRPPEPAAARKADLYLFGLVAVMSRLAQPWQLVRIATRAAESDSVIRIAETPYGVAIQIVLGEIDATVRELRAELKARRPVAGLLRSLHDAVRGLRTEVDLSVDSAWSRQLTAIRAEVSALLKAEIEPTCGRVRRLLRPRPDKEIRPGSVLDKIDVDDAEVLVEIVAACRNYAGELAASEVTMRTYSELQQQLETGSRVLVDSLRQAGEADGPFRQSQVDAAIRFCKILFGPDYAALIAKAAEVAVQAAPADRKVARA